jgi:tetratricopeptide (TPR) repeat protein
MPVLEALERLSRSDRQLISLISTIAPTWMAQMPSLQLADTGGLARVISPGPSEQMLREFARLMEVVAADRPLVILLEDLQWCDLATVDLLSMVAQRTERARLLVIGTYRPWEAQALSHPIVHTIGRLTTRRLCWQLALEDLTREGVAEYLHTRLGGLPVCEEVTTLVHDQTGGNPLFVISLTDHLLASAWVIERKGIWTLAGPDAEIADDLPQELNRVVEMEFSLLSRNERALLDIASVVGAEFDAQQIAAVFPGTLEDVELLCDRLCRHAGLLLYTGLGYWPDGSSGGHYSFVRKLHQRVLYRLLPPARCRSLHQGLGERLEAGYGGGTAAVADQLAFHFQRSGDRQRALKYIEEFARRAFTLRQYQGAARDLESALSLTANLPSTPEVAASELRLRLLYSATLSQAHGYGADGLQENLIRGLDLADRVNDESARVELLYQLATLYANRGHRAKAVELSKRLLELLMNLPDFTPWRAQWLSGTLALWSGDLRSAQQLLASPRTASSVEDVGIPWFGVDPRIGANSCESLRLWVAGEADRACSAQMETIGLAERLDYPLTTAQALTAGAIIQVLCEDWPAAARLASRAIETSTIHAFARELGAALVCRGRALAGDADVERGRREIREGLQMLQRIGLPLGSSLLFALQASACSDNTSCAEGLSAVEQGLAVCRDAHERLFESELWRLKGDLLLKRGHADPATPTGADNGREAAECLARAVASARSVGARALEDRAKHTSKVLRAVM